MKDLFVKRFIPTNN